MEILQGKQLGHRKSREVTKADLPVVTKQIDELIKFMDENNGNFDHQHYKDAHALHSVQVDPQESPFNFFVVSKDLFEKKKKPSEEEKKLTDENYYFPARAIINPVMVTSLMTYIDTVDRIQKGTGRVMGTDKKAINNVLRVDEACMSYKFREAKGYDRFYYITVKYQTLKNGKLIDHEEKIHGLKSHIFQHEMDHANGIDIAHGDAEGVKTPIEERVMENGVTLQEYEKQQEDWVKRIIEKNEYAIIEHIESGDLHRLALDEVIPDGYSEGGLRYYNEDGTMKKEYIKAPIIKGEKYEQEQEDTQTSEEEAKA